MGEWFRLRTSIKSSQSRPDSGSAATGRFFDPEKHNNQTYKDQAAGDKESLAEPQVISDKASEGGTDDPTDKPGPVVYSHSPAAVVARCKVRNHRRRRSTQRGPGNAFHGLNRKSELNAVHQGIGYEDKEKAEHSAKDYRFSPVAIRKASEERTRKGPTQGPGSVNEANLAGGGAEVSKEKSKHRIDHSGADHYRKDGEAKGIKALVQRLITPLRIFYHKRVRPTVVKQKAAVQVLSHNGAVVAERRERSRPRIVVDTNVVMGGLINPVKASGRLVHLWLEGKVDVLVSPALREEYLHIFNRMRFGPREAVDWRERAMQKLLTEGNMTMVEPDIRLSVVREDPSDNRLIECAVCGGAGYIVSQDKHLLRVGEFQGVKILTAQAFLAREFPEVI